MLATPKGDGVGFWNTTPLTTHTYQSSLWFWHAQFFLTRTGIANNDSGYEVAPWPAVKLQAELQIVCVLSGFDFWRKISAKQNHCTMILRYWLRSS